VLAGRGIRSGIENASWLPCYQATAHPGESALSSHLDCIEARLYYSLNGLIAEAAGAAELAWAAGDADTAYRAEIVVLDVRARLGDSSGARDGFLALLPRLPAGSALGRRAQALLGSTYDRLGQRLDAGRWLQDALAGWPADDHPAWRAEALMISALIGLSRTNVDYTLVHHAVEQVARHADPFLHVATLANFAEVSAECGDLSVSAQFADAACAMLRRHPELTTPLTLDSIARAWIALGEITPAGELLERALELESELHCTDVQGDPWLTLAEVRLAAGDGAAAWQLLEAPARDSWAARSSWTASRDLKLRAAVLAALGDWQAAYTALLEHLSAYEGLRSVEGDRAITELDSVQLAQEERRRAAEFERLALTDPLTGLPNRRRVERWLAEQKHTHVSMTIIDLDHFKRINDSFSHDCGDEVLRRVAGALLAEADGRMLVARLGGEEFVQLAGGLTPDQARSRAEQVLRALRRLALDDIAPGLRITASAGLAFGRAGDATDLLRAADRSLYAAKRQGRDRVVVAADAA